MRGKGLLFLGLILAVALPVEAQWGRKKKDKEEPFALKTELDSLSYSLALGVTSNLLEKDLDTLSAPAFVKAVEDFLVANNTMLSTEEAQAYVTDYFRKKQQREAEAVKVKGEAFLAENAKKEGVTTLPSGLQYEVITEGESNKTPEITDRVKVHYHGTLIDGTVFDSSVQRGRPAQFPVNGVIRGWVEALQLMNPGDKWRLFIPQDLAYGSRSTGKIPGYSTLIFEVELLEIL